MELGDNRELIRFITVDVMIEPMILGLAWLDKWKPTIWWEGGYQKVRLEVGPKPSMDRICGQGSSALPAWLLPQHATQRVVRIPKDYANLDAVFRETECDTLPPHRTTDCAIEFVPAARFPKP